ncbi:hypothetical protein H696_00380 [Fonticula alba]|uniref:SPRY domain-containing protein n=1 Tax=Fonticula alba TaxID=691883 RepID=A0A058ZH42_FONAL|nr:hypothetical protein H696_00380 [Fonticula alba]KCV72802.1 hypothetical protein H696_00380 [Fonticula alba]|eukprot:XP_009492503.1 hypothetical protein H696_00380 [Fonticula alba]
MSSGAPHHEDHTRTAAMSNPLGRRPSTEDLFHQFRHITGPPSERPYNRDGYRYCWAELDPHLPIARERIPPAVALSLEDRASVIRLSEAPPGIGAALPPGFHCVHGGAGAGRAGCPADAPAPDPGIPNNPPPDQPPGPWEEDAQVVCRRRVASIETSGYRSIRATHFAGPGAGTLYFEVRLEPAIPVRLTAASVLASRAFRAAAAGCVSPGASLSSALASNDQILVTLEGRVVGATTNATQAASIAAAHLPSLLPPPPLAPGLVPAPATSGDLPAGRASGRQADPADALEDSLPRPAVRVGVSTRHGALDAPVGADAHGFGLVPHAGTVVHDARCRAYGPPLGEYRAGDVIGILLHLPGDPALAVAAPVARRERVVIVMKNHLFFEDPPNALSTVEDSPTDGQPGSPGPGSLSFLHNGRFLGEAFTNLPQQQHFSPTISLYYGARVSVNFGPIFDRPPCRQQLPEHLREWRPFSERVRDSAIECTVNNLLEQVLFPRDLRQRPSRQEAPPS